MRVTQQDLRLAPRPPHSPRPDTLDYLATAWIDVDRSFEEFWRARGKKLRQNLRKQRRRLEGQGGGISFELLQHELRRRPEVAADPGRVLERAV